MSCTFVWKNCTRKRDGNTFKRYKNWNTVLIHAKNINTIQIGIDWFLDQDVLSHPKGGYFRILEESLLWEERLGKTRFKTREGFTTCMEPHRGWTIASSSWIFLRKRWLDQEQELITVIQENIKRAEKKEEAWYRSPTWSILRALQQIMATKPRDLKARL